MRGVAVDWRTVIGEAAGSFVRLPTYAFQRSASGWRGAGGRWRSGLSWAGRGRASAAGRDGRARRRRAARCFTGRLSLRAAPWLADHAVLGTVLLPGTAFVELALHAGAESGCEELRELVLEAPLVLGEQDTVQLQVAVGEPDAEGCRTSASSRGRRRRMRKSLSSGPATPAGWWHSRTRPSQIPDPLAAQRCNRA